MTLRVYILAGEPSGDKLGGALLAALHSLVDDLQIKGVGGPAMHAQGLDSLYPMNELSVMGIAEVLPKYPELRRRLHETAKDCLAWQPDVLITIDSPDFSLRLAKLVRQESNVRTVHYVAPSVWAWRPGRAAKMAAHIDHVLALLPFEPPFMEEAGMTCDFVGHPIVSEPVANDEAVSKFRGANGIDSAPLVLVLPGSRRAEVERLSPIFGEALRTVVAKRPDARVVVAAAAPVASAVIELTKNWPGLPIVIDPRDQRDAEDRKRAAFRGADVSLAASGTVSLELAANATPTVIAYDMNWLSWQVMSRMAKVDTVTLVNLVMGENVVHEFLGPACKPAAIAESLLSVLQDAESRDAQIQAMEETMFKLGKGGEEPGMRAAKSVLNALKKPH